MVAFLVMVYAFGWSTLIAADYMLRPVAAIWQWRGREVLVILG
jgi:hypothetical protein